MRFTERVKEIVELNLTDHYIPLVVQADHKLIYPMYYAQMMGENTIAFPVTAATGINKALEKASLVSMIVADLRGGGCS